MRVSSFDAAIAASKALGHHARLRTVAMLRSGELCLCQITEVLSLAPSTVSLHIKELRRAGLVNERRDGRWVYFSLADDLHARRWLDAALESVADDPQLERDLELVAEIRKLPLVELCSIGFEAAKAKLDDGASVHSGGDRS